MVVAEEYFKTHPNHLTLLERIISSKVFNKDFFTKDIKYINQFKLTYNEFEKATLKFNFTMKDCTIISGVIADVMPCDCCNIWKGDIQIKKKS